MKGLLRYAGAFAAVAAATLLTLPLAPWMGGSYAIFFFASVLLAGFYGGYLPAVLASALATVSLGYFFLAPANSLSRFGVGDLIRFGGGVEMTLEPQAPPAPEYTASVPRGAITP